MQTFFKKMKLNTIKPSHFGFHLDSDEDEFNFDFDKKIALDFINQTISNRLGSELDRLVNFNGLNLFCKDFYFYAPKVYSVGIIDGIIPQIRFILEDNLGNDYLYIYSENPTNSFLDTDYFNTHEPKLFLEQGIQGSYIDFTLTNDGRFDIYIDKDELPTTEQFLLAEKFLSNLQFHFVEYIQDNVIDIDFFILKEIAEQDAALLTSLISDDFTTNKGIENAINTFGSENLFGLNYPVTFLHQEKSKKLLRLNI